MRPLVELESNAVQYNWAVRMNHKIQQDQELQPTNLCKHTVHSYRTGMLKEGVLGQFHYQGAGRSKRRLYGGRTL